MTDKKVNDLLRRVEDELGLSLSSSGGGKDSELEHRLDFKRIAQAHGPSHGYAEQMAKRCDLVLHNISQIEHANAELQGMMRLASQGVIAVALRYVWNRLTGRKVRTLEELVRLQLGNVHRFNDALGQLVVYARHQLDAGMREYLDMSAGYEAMERHRAHYAGALERKQALAHELEQRLVGGDTTGRDKRGDAGGNTDALATYRRAAWLLGKQVEELRHGLARYDLSRAEEDMVEHETLDERLREHAHLWEELHQDSLAFERRAVRLAAMAPQLVAQHRLTGAVQRIMGLFSAYSMEMRSRLEMKLLEMAMDTDATRVVYGRVGASEDDHA